jgi:hypothetical protein
MSHKTGLLVVLLAALITALGPLSSVAHAARGMEIAVEDEDAFVDQKVGSRFQALQAAAVLGATRMRILVQWSRVSDAGSTTPSGNPDYNWGPIDDAIDIAAQAGMRTQLTLAGPAPNYAAGAYKGLRIVNPNPKLFAWFALAAATHFKGRVDRYGIWNEPNYPAWIQPQRQSPKIYRALYEAGYKAIKAADPSAQVLIGETVPYGGREQGKQLGTATPPLKWLREVLCVDAQYRKSSCPGLKADGYAHHPYDLTLQLPPTGRFPGADNAPIQSLGNLRTALNKLARLGALTDARGRPLDIYLTESGYFVKGSRATAAAKRAKYLVQQFQVAAQQPSVRSMLQYNIFVPTTSTFTTGLLTPSGSPLPEYGALAGWAQEAARSGEVKRNTGPIEIPSRPSPPTPGAEAPAPLQPSCQLQLLGICILQA